MQWLHGRSRSHYLQVSNYRIYILVDWSEPFVSCADILYMLLRAFSEKTLTESALQKKSHGNQRGEGFGFGFKLDTRGPEDPPRQFIDLSPHTS